jgi:hypothetical protein
VGGTGTTTGVVVAGVATGAGVVTAGVGWATTAGVGAGGVIVDVATTGGAA